MPRHPPQQTEHQAHPPDEPKHYISKHDNTPGNSPVYVKDNDDIYELDPRHDLASHSKGFAWGYGGSGPAQLALAILADARGDTFAITHYQKFKWEAIANYPSDKPLNISEVEINAVIGAEA